MSLSFTQTSNAPSGAAPALVTREAACLDAASNAKVIRLALKSLLLVLACVLVKLPLAPLVLLLFLIFLKSRHRLQATDLVAVWLVAAPFLGPYIAVHLGGRIPDLNFNRLFVLLLLFSAGSQKGPRVLRLTNPLDYSLLFFMGVCLVSVTAGFMIRTPLRLFMDALLIPCAFYFVAKKCVGNADFLPKLFIAACLASLAMASLGVYEGVIGRDVLQFDEQPEDSVDFRVNGPFGTASDLGLIITMLFLFTLTFKYFRRQGLVPRWCLRAAALLCVLAVGLTKTRGIWIALLVGWLVYHLRRRPKLTLSLAGIGVVVWLVLQEAVLPNFFGEFWQNRIAQKATIYARIATYKSALAMFADHPLLGVGYANFGEAWERCPEKYFFQYKDIDSVGMPHNLFLSILAETGLVGGLAFLIFQFHVFRNSFWLARRRDDEIRAQCGRTMIALAASFMIAGTSMSFTYNVGFLTKVYFLFLGVLSGLVDRTRAEPHFGITTCPPDSPEVRVGPGWSKPSEPGLRPPAE